MKKICFLGMLFCFAFLGNIKAFAGERIAFSHSYEINNYVYLDKDLIVWDEPIIWGSGNTKYLNEILLKGTLIGSINLRVGVTRSTGTMRAGEGGSDWGQMYENNLGALTTIQPAEIYAYYIFSGKNDMSNWTYRGGSKDSFFPDQLYVANDVVTNQITLEPKNGKNCYIAAWSPRNVSDMSGSEKSKLTGKIEKKGKISFSVDFWGKAAINGSLGLSDGSWSIGGSLNITSKYVELKDCTSTKNNKYMTTYTFDRKTTFKTCGKDRSNVVYRGQTIESSLQWMYNKPNYQYLGNNSYEDAGRVFSSTVRFVVVEDKNEPRNVWSGTATVSRDINYKLP